VNVRSAVPAVPEKHFWHRLESLRGIFALTVAVHHAYMMILAQDSAARVVRGVQGIFYGQGAVLAFFILSGLVLGQSLRRSTDGVFRPFYIRRFFRIYPTLAASVILGAVLVLWGLGSGENVAASSSFRAWYRPPLTGLMVLKNLILYDFALNNVTWTLWVEIVGSFFLPFFHVLSGRVVYRVGLMIVLVGLSA